MYLAEKPARIGWTFADALKNVRKRLSHKNRDYILRDYSDGHGVCVVSYTASRLPHAEKTLCRCGQDRRLELKH
jgi:hypothetical protein